ncbi:MAG TPA: DsbA family oxidoreductase [Alphaproteobacteria bacterium]|nr:DsbA family oxidoreductase [Alphaproteobacteria bacterium]
MQIEFYGDLVCPWCYIGRERLRRALASRPDLAPTVVWRPFQLNPDMPAGGMERDRYLALKFGGLQRVRPMLAYLQEAALRDGLPLSLDRMTRTPNSLNAHRLVLFAERQGRAEAVLDALMAAYFVEGRDIGDTAELRAIAVTAGLDPGASAAYLAGSEDAETVRRTEAQARQLGVQAVPCFIFAGRYALAGAQEPAAFLPLIDLMALDQAPVSVS